MHFRRERVRIETQRHEMEGTLQLPNEGYRSRTTDFLNAHEREFLALTDAELSWLDGTREPEHQEEPQRDGRLASTAHQCFARSASQASSAFTVSP